MIVKDYKTKGENHKEYKSVNFELAMHCSYCSTDFIDVEVWKCMLEHVLNFIDKTSFSIAYVASNFIVKEILAKK